MFDDSENKSDGKNDSDNGGERVLFATRVTPDELRERAQLVDTPAGRLALLLKGDEVIAIDPWCPHLDGPLWEGGVHQDEIGCPWHAWRYSLTTGKCTWAPKGDTEEAADTEIRILQCQISASGHIAVVMPAAQTPEEPL